MLYNIKGEPPGMGGSEMLNNLENSLLILKGTRTGSRRLPARCREPAGSPGRGGGGEGRRAEEGAEAAPRTARRGRVGAGGGVGEAGSGVSRGFGSRRR